MTGRFRRSETNKINFIFWKKSLIEYLDSYVLDAFRQHKARCERVRQIGEDFSVGGAQELGRDRPEVFDPLISYFNVGSILHLYVLFQADRVAEDVLGLDVEVEQLLRVSEQVGLADLVGIGGRDRVGGLQVGGDGGIVGEDAIDPDAVDVADDKADEAVQRLNALVDIEEDFWVACRTDQCDVLGPEFFDPFLFVFVC